MQDLENQIKTWRTKFSFSVGENRRLYDEQTIQMTEDYNIKQNDDVNIIEDSLSFGFKFLSFFLSRKFSEKLWNFCSGVFIDTVDSKQRQIRVYILTFMPETDH